jgi:RNA polymerase sigma-70 factor (sigma-E family)
LCDGGGVAAELGVADTVTAAVGPSAPFDAFYAGHRPELVRLAHLLCGSRAVAEELAQEALWAVHRRWDDLDKPAAYARAALVNQVRSLHRRRVHEERYAAGLPPEPLTLAPEVDEAWQAIRSLPTPQRIVVVLRFYDDLTIPEIAELVHRPAGTVKSLLHRALRRLEEELR